MKSFPLTILSPKGSAFNEAVISVSAPGTEGSFGVLAEHIPMVATLKAGVLKVRTAAQTEKFFALDSGVLEVQKSREVLVLLDNVWGSPDEQSAQSKARELQAARN